MNEEEKGFKFTKWINSHAMEEKISYRCIGFDLESGKASEWVQDENGNRIEENHELV